MSEDEYIDGFDLELEEWLNAIFNENGPKVFPSSFFPSDNMLDEYLLSIRNRSEYDVKKLLRKLLVYSGFFGIDQSNLDTYNFSKNSDDEVLKKFYEKNSKIEYYRRLSEGEYAWEGITWILDLLPRNPGKAIDVLNAYFTAHMFFIPDSAIFGITHATAIIRAKFLEVEQPKELFLSLKPEQFEWLVEYLYEQMGYDASVTQYSKDGGVDVIACKNGIGESEKLIIQCKRYSNKVNVKAVRELLGVLPRFVANKGVIVSTAGFTRDAFKEKGSMELIGCKELNMLLNKHCGTNWHYHIDNILRNKEHQHSKRRM